MDSGVRLRFPYNFGMAIDPAQHPLLHDLVQGAQWVGQDDFPSCRQWADECEAWLRFIKQEGLSTTTCRD